MTIWKGDSKQFFFRMCLDWSDYQLNMGHYIVHMFYINLMVKTYNTQKIVKHKTREIHQLQGKKGI